MGTTTRIAEVTVQSAELRLIAEVPVAPEWLDVLDDGRERWERLEQTVLRAKALAAACQEVMRRVSDVCFEMHVALIASGNADLIEEAQAVIGALSDADIRDATVIPAAHR